MMWTLAISAALVLVLLGAYARMVTLTPPKELSTIEDEPDAPHRDDRHGGDW